MIEKKIPVINDTLDDLVCTSCLLPMQYQSKMQDDFVWQCFKCGKKYFVKQTGDACDIKESWSSPK